MATGILPMEIAVYAVPVVTLILGLLIGYLAQAFGILLDRRIQGFCPLSPHPSPFRVPDPYPRLVCGIPPLLVPGTLFHGTFLLGIYERPFRANPRRSCRPFPCCISALLGSSGFPDRADRGPSRGMSDPTDRYGLGR